ncbi:lipopolysaccharide transport periplasmic protein LptA [Candidatus Pseudomonas adelgestsugas]|uniref:Lipopolysaccharide export system protein LptA n=1 Tax=Candidatus Pseudomonas adelgestsugas TaxID=1302376 RepID=A0ABX5R8A2_9PSED|nr:lipopolysaccharide transport periplasmic protein LptA [Candidatus Pseudomonas adelgestsugas]QAX81857.1 Lipopolysaccharide export system protein LptA precursor [Candidatus Pseudomonas adelgestsugas]
MKFVNILHILLGLCAALESVIICALPSDSQQSIYIQADNAQLDNKQGVATYTGAVIITQGSMKITGNTVTFTRTMAGEIDVVTAVGNLAYFEQQQSASDQTPMKGYGRIIQYLAQQNRIILIDQARVVSSDGNTTDSEKITYDTVKQIAQAGRATGIKISTPRPQIDMVIQSKQKDGVSLHALKPDTNKVD